MWERERLGRPLFLHENVGAAQTVPEAHLVDELDTVLEATRRDRLGQVRRERARTAPLAAGRTAAHDDGQPARRGRQSRGAVLATAVSVSPSARAR